jgi:hypothetical protein
MTQALYAHMNKKIKIKKQTNKQKTQMNSGHLRLLKEET